VKKREELVIVIVLFQTLKLVSSRIPREHSSADRSRSDQEVRHASDGYRGAKMNQG
jgi:hypothetical protein